jgi:hypothetical protein
MHPAVLADRPERTPRCVSATILRMVACFDGVVGSAPPPQATQEFYLELADNQWNQGSDEGVAWWETQHRLAAQFEEICGDSFCEGEYPDIAPLRLACSVNANTQRVSRCAYAFAAADLSVDARGQLSAVTTTKRCTFPVGAAAAAFTSALAGDDPLYSDLPRPSEKFMPRAEQGPCRRECHCAPIVVIATRPPPGTTASVLGLSAKVAAGGRATGQRGEAIDRGGMLGRCRRCAARCQPARRWHARRTGRPQRRRARQKAPPTPTLRPVGAACAVGRMRGPGFFTSSCARTPLSITIAVSAPTPAPIAAPSDIATVVPSAGVNESASAPAIVPSFAGGGGS